MNIRRLNILVFAGLVVALLPMAGNLRGQETRRAVTPEDYYSIKDPSDAHLSPDGKLVVYVVSFIEGMTKVHSDIWIAAADGSGPPRQLTRATDSSNSPRWSPDGMAIAFLSLRPGSADDKAAKRQVQLLSLDGGEAHQITTLKNGVNSFSWSPDGKRLVCVSTTPAPDPPANAGDERHIVHSMYKRDGSGYLSGGRTHIWIVDVGSGQAKQITEGADWDDSNPEWSPDGSRIAFVSDRSGKAWEDYEFDYTGVWIVSSEGGEPKKVSEANGALHSNPRWSPDGRLIAYFGEELGNDPLTLFLITADGTARPRVLIRDLDNSTSNLQWAEGGRSLYFVSKLKGTEQIYRLDVSTGAKRQLTEGDHGISGLIVGSSQMTYTQTSFERPFEIMIAHLDGTVQRPLTDVNGTLFQKLAVQTVERLPYKAKDGTDVDGFLVRPAGWQAGKKYPMVLVIHGGPEAMFATRWNLPMQYLAARGYAVLFTNPRGSTGYGTAFMRGATREWGGKIYTDIMGGVDAALAKNSWIDPEKLGVTGCSFGGYMTNWIVTQTTRFKAAVPMCSISNYISDEGARDYFYGHSDDFGGDLYQNFDLYWKYSPIRYAMNVKTPVLILHGDADQRVPLEQAEEWFRALHHFNVPSELVIFPRESHDGLSYGEPKHVVSVMHWADYWFDRYINGNANAAAPDSARK